jgi:hypothetical protein
MRAPATARSAHALLLALPALLIPGGVEAQFQVRDLVASGGVSGEGYQGNLPTAGVALRDSTESATALVGELGLRGDAAWRRNGFTRVFLSVDGGVRQFTARGFEQRDYAPREWVGRADVTGLHPLGEHVVLLAFAGIRGRGVEDRPPMPLFLQPTHRALQGGGALRVYPRGWDLVELSVSGERADYAAPEFAPQIRLLDREMLTTQLSVERTVAETHGIETFVAMDRSAHREQETFNPDDPFRRDTTLRGRLGWSHRGQVLARVGLEGRMNRSNSRRPEYDSVTLDGQVTMAVPGSAIASAYVVLTGKRYRESTPFARLLPGEEANSASLVYLSLSRPVSGNLDSGVRLGWTRAETETGGEYFQRLGVSFLLTYRPLR